LSTQTRKATEQKLIKQQQLGMRGHVNEQSATPPDEGSLLPAQVSLAEEFGVSLKGVQRQNQLIKSRR
jgi:predicted NUDIX family phosphoesterase